MRKIAWLYTRILALRLQGAIKYGQISKREALHTLARAAIGQDASPSDIAPDELGCAESVTELIKLIMPFKVHTFTGYLADALNQDDRFERIYTEPMPGDIILSPTPFVGSKNVGHTGIYTVGEGILSNSSYSGVWKLNYDQNSWYDRYFVQKSLSIYTYRIVE